jgi:hypothetical protein
MVGPLPVGDFVSVIVSAATNAIAPESFNQGLIVGPSTVIPSYGANPRLQPFPSTAAMLSAGFTNASPEYIAAEAYFGQNEVPSQVWIGRQDLTAIQTVYPHGRRVADGAMSSTSNPTQLSSATASFVSGDIGSAVRVPGAGTSGADLSAIIVSISSGTVAVLNTGATTTVSGAAVTIAAAGGRTISDAGMSSSSNPTYLSSSTAAFVTGDVGSVVVVPGAGAAGDPLIGIIVSINSGTVAILSVKCLTTVSNATIILPGLSNYAAGTTFSVAGGMNALLTVLEVALGGIPVELGTTIGNQGTGFTATTETTTTVTGTGSGMSVDISAVGESYLQAVEACSTYNDPWYFVMCCNASDADHLALAAWSNANWQTALYVGASTTTAIEAGTAGNVALQLQALKYKAMLMFTTTQSAEYPNNVYGAGALMGLACGLNTGLAGSYFTMNLKPISDVAPEPVSEAQETAILNAYCSFVGTWGPYIGYLRAGQLSSGDYMDQILFRAMLVNEIQVNLMNVLISTPSVPQTNPGEHQLIQAVEQACANLASIGYIGPGVYTGATILNLLTGTSLPSGYRVQAQSYAGQSAGDRAARKAMPIYATILEAGAVHTVQVLVSVSL